MKISQEGTNRANPYSWGIFFFFGGGGVGWGVLKEKKFQKGQIT